VAFDEQIFTMQRHGGISRVFTEIAGVFATGAIPDVTISPIGAPVVNEHLLHDQRLAQAMGVRRSSSWQWALTRCMLRAPWRGQVDILHSTFYLKTRMRDYPRAKHVVTVHDMIPELFPATRMRLRHLADKHRYALHADQIICVSEATKTDLLELYGDIQTPITVVHSGVSPEFHAAQKQSMRPSWLPEQYVLFVGKRSGYKDSATLIRAFARLAVDHPTLTLLLAGGEPFARQEAQQCTDLGIRNRVIQRTVGEGDMPAVYAHAQLFVFPSQYEGFGLPALEAMACGTPTVLCRASALPEVGGDAARYFDPGDDAKLATLIDEVISDSKLGQAMRHEGLKRAAGFTWDRTARGVAEAYQQALAR